MTSLLRILGVDVMVQLGRRLPAPVSRLISALLLLAANLLPLWAVLAGRLGIGDAIVIYWFENLVVWFTTTVRILTVKEPDRKRRARAWVTGDRAAARSFAIRYGAVTLALGVVSVVLAALTGLHGSLLDWVATIALILFSHALSLGLHWFGRRECTMASTAWVMASPYPRMIAVNLTVIGGLLLLGGPAGRMATELAPVAVLMGVKTAIDLGFHVAEHLVLVREARGRAAAASV